MVVEFLYYEIVILAILILTVFGFFDRIFLILGLILNWIFTLNLLADGSLITDKVYNATTSTWILYTQSVLTATNIPTTPILVLLMFVAIDGLLFIKLSGYIW